MSQNFQLQKENGITIRSFWGKEVDDMALIHLLPILLNIAKNHMDVRKGIALYKNVICCFYNYLFIYFLFFMNIIILNNIINKYVKKNFIKKLK